MKQMPTLQSRWNEIVIGLIKYSIENRATRAERRKKFETHKQSARKVNELYGWVFVVYFGKKHNNSECNRFLPNLSRRLFFAFAQFSLKLHICIFFIFDREFNGCLWWVISTHSGTACNNFWYARGHIWLGTKKCGRFLHESFAE